MRLGSACTLFLASSRHHMTFFFLSLAAAISSARHCDARSSYPILLSIGEKGSAQGGVRALLVHQWTFSLVDGSSTKPLTR